MSGLVALALAGTATAAPSVAFTFTGTTGTGATGGDTIDALPGDVITMVMSITGDANGLSFTGVSMQWDPLALTAASSVECPSALNSSILPDGSCLKNGLPDFSTIYNNSLQPGAAIDNVTGTTDQFTASAIPGASGVFTLFTGQIEFTAVGAGSHVVSTFYQPGLDSINDNLGNTFAVNTSGTINVVPEPGTAGLMGLGLLALGMVGRRRS
jgi:hypothetical protein